MKVYENFDLTHYNGYKISSRCRKAFLPESEEDVSDIIRLNPDIVFLGSGHNIILSQSYYDRDFMIFNGNFNTIALGPNGILEVEAGALMADASLFALENQLSGIEVFYDIPSSLGGAVVMNAGAGGEEIKDVLLKVRYLNLNTLTVHELDAKDANFEYRNSFFQKNPGNLVLKAWLKLQPSNYTDIKTKMDQVKDSRWAKQPRDYPNCGSVFKRPQGRFVGPMLDELGLKGYVSGGARISEKHSGFIVNFDNAKGEDILNLIKEVQKRVYDKFQILLEVEQRII
jgi:UDP-N-acetylmuramate dehydrogenase